MRWQYALAGIFVVTGAPIGLAQDTPSLCNPCVDPPLWNRRMNTESNFTVVITAEEMRSLGIVSVADMIAQLPGTVAEGVPGQTDSQSDEAEEAVSDADAAVDSPPE